RAAEVEVDVERGARVVRQLILRLLMELEPLWLETEREVPAHALLLPVLEPFHVGLVRRLRARIDEELHLHLLELTRPEDEVAGRDLVPKRFTDLRDAKRNLLTRRLLN